MKHLSFKKNKRLLSNRQFKAVLAHGLRASDGILVLYVCENDCSYPRLGISIGRSHGNAVVRNRLKRLLREAFRQSQHDIPAGFDYLLMISPQRVQISKTHASKEALKQLTLSQIKTSFLTLVEIAVRKVKPN